MTDYTADGVLIVPGLRVFTNNSTRPPSSPSTTTGGTT